MRIAICDDERTALETLSALTEDYCLQTRRTAEYTVFDSYEALEESAEQFDVYILDYIWLKCWYGLSLCRFV